MVVKWRVTASMHWVVCDDCGFRAPEKPDPAEAQAEAHRIGFRWVNVDGAFDYRDLCERCFAKFDAAREQGGGEEE